MSTGGRSSTCCLVMLSWMPSSTRVTERIGMATSFLPHRCPSASSTWVTWCVRRSTTSPWTRPMLPSVASTGSPRRTSTSPSGTVS